jgi:imidazolonepropionase-like amidohydrolase
VESDLGSLTPGKLADLVAMPANPLRDVRAMRGIDVVVKDGKLVRNGLA